MASRSILRNVFLREITESWLPLPFMTPIISAHKKISSLKPNCGCRAAMNSRSYQFEVAVSAKSSQFARNCANIGSASSSSDDYEQEPPQEAVLKAIAEISKTDGRVGQTTNVVIGGTVTDDTTNEWLALDQKVNSYPTVRGFTAIGTGGDDFVHAMMVAVESVILRPIPELLNAGGCKVSFESVPSAITILGTILSVLCQVKQKISSGGKYVSVNIGPVQVVSSEQVQAVYNAMRRDNRMKYFL